LGLFDYGSEFAKHIQMEINRATADVATAKVRNESLA
jgi:hypothetical protein